jgi:uroporphyrinogen-III synthase
MNDEQRAWFPTTWHVSEVPATRTRVLPVEEIEAQAAACGTPAAWWIVTSARCVPGVAAVGEAPRIAAVGEKTATALREAGYTVTLMAPHGAASLAPMIAEGPVWLLGAAEKMWTGDELRERGLEVCDIALYVTEPLTLSKSDQQIIHEADVVVVGAPSAWRVLRESVAPSAIVLVPGASTASLVDHGHIVVGWDGDTVASGVVEPLS